MKLPTRSNNPNPLYSAECISTDNGNTRRYFLTVDGKHLSYLELLEHWEKDNNFLEFFLSLFKQSGFESYVWETLPVCNELLNQQYEFAIIKQQQSLSEPDYRTFKDYFDPKAPNSGVLAFPNLGNDAVLIVPSPLKEQANYSGLAEFFVHAPAHQQYALFRILAREIRLKLSDQKIWVSVAGGGVSWLHVRIDTSPKYYRYQPYTDSS